MSQFEYNDADHTYTLDGRRIYSATQILQDLKLTPPYAEAPMKKLFGDAVHKATDLRVWNRLDLDKTHADVQPYVRALDQKIREMKIEPIKTELRLYHGRELYAGTLDLFCWIYDRKNLAIFDYKTGNPAECVGLQLSLYEQALHWMMANGILYAYGLPIRRFSMQLKPDRALVTEYKDDYDHAAALAAARLHRWTKEKRKS